MKSTMCIVFSAVIAMSAVFFNSVTAELNIKAETEAPDIICNNMISNSSDVMPAVVENALSEAAVKSSVSYYEGLKLSEEGWVMIMPVIKIINNPEGIERPFMCKGFKMKFDNKTNGKLCFTEYSGRVSSDLPVTCELTNDSIRLYYENKGYTAHDHGLKENFTEEDECWCLRILRCQSNREMDQLFGKTPKKPEEVRDKLQALIKVYINGAPIEIDRMEIPNENRKGLKFCEFFFTKSIEKTQIEALEVVGVFEG